MSGGGEGSGHGGPPRAMRRTRGKSALLLRGLLGPELRWVPLEAEAEPALLSLDYFSLCCIPEAPEQGTQSQDGDVFIPPLKNITPSLMGQLRRGPRLHSTPVGE